MMRITGKEISEKILLDLKKRIKKLQDMNCTPHLAVLLIGNDPASVAYINQKSLRAEDIGAVMTLFNFPDSVTTEEILQKVKELNNDPSTHGIIVQRPFPSSLDAVEINYAVKPNKDVDGFHPETYFTPPLALAVMKILEEIFISIEKNSTTSYLQWLHAKKILIIGKGKAGGMPISQYLETLKIPYTLMDSKTENKSELMKHADIIISAVGNPKVIPSDSIKKGVILIGVGLKKIDKKLVGDYDEASIAHIASFYTPIPGGVGPVNVAMLLSNLLTAAEQQTS